MVAPAMLLQGCVLHGLAYGPGCEISLKRGVFTNRFYFVSEKTKKNPKALQHWGFVIYFKCP